MKTLKFVLFAFLLAALPVFVGCKGLNDDQKTKLANVTQAESAAVNSWLNLNGVLKEDVPGRQAVVNRYINGHGVGLADEAVAFKLLQVSMKQGLHDATIKQLIDLEEKARYRAENFDRFRQYLVPNDGIDRTSQMDQHAKDLHALADAVKALADSLTPVVPAPPEPAK